MAEGKAKKFRFLKWNGKYSDEAVFIVMNTKSGKRTLFTPDFLSDLAWTKDEIENLPEYKDWQDFGNEEVDSLADVVF